MSNAHEPTKEYNEERETALDTDTAHDLHQMRFQIQWNTGQGGPTFSRFVTASATMGVTVAEAITALETVWLQVVPTQAKMAARAAVDKQEQWIRDRPANGGVPPGYRRTVKFKYKNYGNARVDVENHRGFNLRFP